MTATPAPQSKVVSWFWATRPFSLSASVAPVLVGTALAATVGALNWLLFALALTGSVAIQIGTNLTDEYSDHRKSGGEGLRKRNPERMRQGRQGNRHRTRGATG